MLITCITHAQAKEGTFRALTEQGTQETNVAAEQYREFAKTLVKKGIYDKADMTIDHIVSSPLPRCLETVILFAKELSDYCEGSEIQIDSGLKAGKVDYSTLFELANNLARNDSGKHVLVSGHADLARVLPKRIRMDLEASKAVENGWFQMRPVLFTLDFQSVQSECKWEDAQVLCLRGNFGSPWRNFL